MMSLPKKIRILFFIENLSSGGKERRLIELLYYLTTKNYDLHLMITEDRIHYNYLHELNIPITIIKRRFIKKDPSLFSNFFRLVKKLQPNIIHTWGSMTTFYAIPSCFLFKIPLINNQIADASPPKSLFNIHKLIWWYNSYFSTCIVANSKAGLNAYKVRQKNSQIIYNGVRLQRFQNLPDPIKIKQKYSIKTAYAVVMVASFSDYKDYDSFVSVAACVCSMREDVTFVAVGDGPNMQKLVSEVRENGPEHFIFTGKINNVEELVNACDIGILLTFGEGLPNAVIEYMALKKPVIASDGGGTNELVVHKKTGFLVSEKNISEVAVKINLLLDHPNLREKMGKLGYKIICDNFTLEKMGYAFDKLYANLLENRFQ
jgi:glycosyltransferase involved in cell wall biosynthesis